MDIAGMKTDKRTSKNSEEKLIPVTLHPPQIAHGLPDIGIATEKA
jgi:hypothetical protein